MLTSGFIFEKILSETKTLIFNYFESYIYGI